MTTGITSHPTGRTVVSPSGLPDLQLGSHHESLGNRFVYAVVSPRANGLTVGVNMNPDKFCNFDCEYCEIDRTVTATEKNLNVEVMAEELQRLLLQAQSRDLHLPENLPRLRLVALSGDGEPTLCPNFLDAVRAVVHIRALGRAPFFKMALITNGTGLDIEQVQDGLRLFTPHDEIWAKMEAGTQRYMEAVNHPDCLLDKILDNILLVARKRPVIIQSLFALLNHEEPSAEEVEHYAERLRDLKRAGAQISLVQVYSAYHRAAHSTCGHLPLKTLSLIAQRVREVSGLRAEVF